MTVSDSTHNTPYIITISIVATIGGFLFGFDSGVINGTVEGLKVAFDSDSAVTGFNVASMLLGCAIGAFIAGNLADKFGRRMIMIVAAIFFIASAWGSGISVSSTEFVFYRILGGLAVGAASVLAPAYISEVTPARFRGAMSTLQQIAIITGLFVSFLSNYFLAGQAGGSKEILALGYEAWRWMFWVELAPAFLFLIALLLIPESPRFLVASGKQEKAMKVLGKLMGDRAKSKFEEINESLAQDHHRPRLSDLLDGGKIRIIAWVGIGLAAFQQFVGINVVFYYGAVLWQAAGFSEENALLINVLSGGISIGAAIITLCIIDKIGRKPLLLIGSIGMAFALGLMALVFSQANVNPEGNLQLEGNSGIMALIAANAYVFIFNATWGPVVWVLLGEMFPNQLRGSGLAVSGLSMWIANFIITLTFPILLTGIGLGGAYSIYTLFSLLSFFFVFQLIKETKGIELEKMKG